MLAANSVDVVTKNWLLQTWLLLTIRPVNLGRLRSCLTWSFGVAMLPHHRLTSSLSRFVYNSNGARPSLRMSSASNDPGPEAGNVSGDEGCAPALGENAALGGIWQLSRGIKFQGSSDQPAQRTWRSDYGIVFSNSKHTQQPITNALAIGSYQRSHFTSSSKVDGPRFDYRPKDAPRSLSLLVHEGNVFGKPPCKCEQRPTISIS